MTEKLEIERSRVEASALTDVDLALTAQNLEKYTHVPRNVAQPLRYAYHLLESTRGGVRGTKVLDYGCGSGENSAVLSALGADVTGIDISPELVGCARRRMEINKLNWRVMEASAYCTGEPDGSYDAVFGIAILHHLNLEKSAQEVYRILKPGGVAVFSEPLRDLAALRKLRPLAPFVVRNASPDEYPLTGRQVREFCSRFQIGDMRRFSSPWGRVISRLGYVWERLDLADRWFNENVTGRLAAFIVFQVRK